jgi:hypothetical protein
MWVILFTLQLRCPDSCEAKRDKALQLSERSYSYEQEIPR